MSQNRGKPTTTNGFKLHSAPQPKTAKEKMEKEAEEKKRAEEIAAAKKVYTDLKDGWIYPETRKISTKAVVNYLKVDVAQAKLFIRELANKTKARIARTLEFNKPSLSQLSDFVEKHPEDFDAYACYALLTDNIVALDVDKLKQVSNYLTEAGI